MEINWYIIGGLSILVIVLVVFLIQKNRKDEQELETFLNNEFEVEDKEDDEVNNPV
ncbi:hypothetical protein ACSVH2_11440 [Flavobacterium sp. RSB2_4_14]|uniref:hypothetical protein n=1 Tax=Flavobacterium sp. RSB2_4_14 TaxID=3447665 RepID=UPI003F3D69F4